MKTTKLVLSIIVMVFAAGSASAATALWMIDGDNVVPDTTAYALFADGEGDDWTGAVLRIDLSAGSAYQDAFEGAGGAAPGTAFFPTFPDLEFDTYVGILNDGSAGIAGGAGDLGGGPASQDAPQISLTWFNTDTSDTGPVQIGNITLSNDAAGTWELIVSFANSQVRSSGVIQGLPEPASLSLMALGGLAVLRRR